MGKKIDDSKSYGQKLISLFARLLFSGEKYSLTELSRFLNCSKQSVMRLIEDIQISYKVDLEEIREGNRRCIRIKRPAKVSTFASLTEREMAVLQMCRAFAEHLLGRQLFEEATLAINKSKALLSSQGELSFDHFGALRFGIIDYSPHESAMGTLIEAMQEKRICKISYQAIMGEDSKNLYVKPLKIFSHKDTVYLHGRLAKTPGKPYIEPDFDPLLAIHRIKQVEMTDRHFEFPANYNFEKSFNRHFGVIKDEAFQVEAVFTGWSARYVAERIWSPDQKIEPLDQDRIKLTCTASSAPEVIAWLLSHGEEVELLKPDWLVTELTNTIKKMMEIY